MPRSDRERARRLAAGVGLGLTLALLLHGGRAQAYCRTTTVGVPADYNPADGTCWTEGLPLYWQNACVGYSIQQDASKQVSYDDAKVAISAAFSKWTSATCTSDGVGAAVTGTGDGDDDGTDESAVDAGNVDVGGQIARVSIDVRDLGPVECDEVTYSSTGPNQHVILFRDSSWPHNDSNNTLALTMVVFNPDTGELYDADMEINTAQQTVTLQDPVPADGYDFQSIVTHETGHFLGMAHSTDEHATMFAHYDPGQTTLRHLTFDDLDGICDIYPPNGTRNTGIGVVPQEACDPTPRHGFSTTCSSSSGCAVSGGRGAGGGGDGALVGVAVGFLFWRRQRRRGPARSERWPRSPASHVRILVDTPEALERMVETALNEPLIALDVESDGLFAYRAGLCVVQIATARDVFVVDTLRPLPLADGPLVKLLGADGPVKVLHDLGFDARLLGEKGVPLARCHDTAITAQLLGRKATGLGTLLLSELGLTVDKSLQTHDWRSRPLEPAQLDYLAGDVEHLLDLDDRLRREAETRGILAEVDEEIAYRLETAEESVREPDERPAYVRVKGIDKLAQGAPGGPRDGRRRRDAELAIVRELAELRENEARARNVPPYRVLGNETLLALATARPRTLAELSRMRGLGVEAGRLGAAILQAVGRGVQAGKIPPEEEHWFERPRVPGEEARAERARQAKLIAWRKTEAAARGVDEQAVLPGHLLRAVAAATADADAAQLLAVLSQVRGMSSRRMALHGAALVEAITREGASETTSASVADGVEVAGTPDVRDVPGAAGAPGAGDA